MKSIYDRADDFITSSDPNISPADRAKVRYGYVWGWIRGRAALRDARRAAKKKTTKKGKNK